MCSRPLPHLPNPKPPQQPLWSDLKETSAWKVAAYFRSLYSIDHSVNDGILKEPLSVQHMKVDEVITGIMPLGRGTLLAEVDVESA